MSTKYERSLGVAEFLKQNSLRSFEINILVAVPTTPCSAWTTNTIPLTATVAVVGIQVGDSYTSQFFLCAFIKNLDKTWSSSDRGRLLIL